MVTSRRRAELMLLVFQTALQLLLRPRFYCSNHILLYSHHDSTALLLPFRPRSYCSHHDSTTPTTILQLPLQPRLYCSLHDYTAPISARTTVAKSKACCRVMNQAWQEQLMSRDPERRERGQVVRQWQQRSEIDSGGPGKGASEAAVSGEMVAAKAKQWQKGG